MANKEEIYKIASFFINFWLIVAAVFIIVYLAAPLLGGKLSLSAILHYGIWIVIALTIKSFLKRTRKGFALRAYEFTILCLLVILNFFIWFSYPLNVIFSILNTAGFIISYKAQKRQRELHIK